MHARVPYHRPHTPPCVSNARALPKQVRVWRDVAPRFGFAASARGRGAAAARLALGTSAAAHARKRRETRAVAVAKAERKAQRKAALREAGTPPM